VFPGDTIENDRVRAMLEELASRKLVRIYEVDGVEYVSIVDWEQIQRVGKHARRRYPSFPEKVPSVSEADEGLPASASAPDDRKPSQGASTGAAPDAGGEKENQFTDPEPMSQAA